MLTIDEIKRRLTEAEKAYTDAISGRGIRVLVDQNGERIEYGPANLNRLNAYIADLKRQLGYGTVSAPMRVFF